MVELSARSNDLNNLNMLSLSIDAFRINAVFVSETFPDLSSRVAELEREVEYLEAKLAENSKTQALEVEERKQHLLKELAKLEEEKNMLHKQKEAIADGRDSVEKSKYAARRRVYPSYPIAGATLPLFTTCPVYNKSTKATTLSIASTRSSSSNRRTSKGE